MEEKVLKAIETIKKGESLALALDPECGYHVAFSGGKDSQVVLELVKMAHVKFEARYNVTGIDAPETIKFMKINYPEVKFIHPKKNFFQLVEEKGLPTVRRRYCCERIKELSDSNCVVITGVRAEESRKRAQYDETMLRSRRKENQGKRITLDEIIESEHRCVKGKDKIMLHPILGWTKDDIVEFFEKYSLTWNPLYEKVDRVGCMICPFSNEARMNMYERMYPGFKKRILLAMKRYWVKGDHHFDSTPEEYYERWKKKIPIGK